MTPQELDDLVKRYIDLDARRTELADECESIKTRIRDELNDGQHETPSGVTVTVSPPSRSFNIGAAINLLPVEALEQCRLDGYDPKKIKRFLAPALLDLCMDAGSGERRVSIR